jgi:calcium-dependent protein kinase
MLYILLSGKPPFDGANDHEITENVKTGQFQMKDKIWKPISDDAKALIKKMLTFDPA